MTDDFIKNVQEWSERIHVWAVEKGWWKDGVANRDFLELTNNFHGEISEAWEEYREGRMDLWWRDMPLGNSNISAEEFAKREYTVDELIEDNYKPEGFWVEVADLCIRVLDVAGAYQWTLDARSRPDAQTDPVKLLSELHRIIADLTAAPKESRMFHATSCLIMAEISARYAGKDLWGLISIKHRYNRTRPYRHGGKRA